MINKNKLSVMCLKRGLIKEAVAISGLKKLKAIILRGKIGHDNLHNLAQKFYKDIATFLEQHGYDVYFDDGDKRPMNGDLWIGHCLAANRFRFAPESTKLIALDSPKLDLNKNIVYVNHPTDISSKTKGSHVPDKYHYIFTNNMKDVISRVTANIILEKIQ